MDLAIETRGLTRRFGAVRAVDGVDLAVPTGSVFGFLGPNGAGKTTTIRIILGLIRATSGEARLLGDVVRPGATVVARVGALVERPAFYPFLSAADNLAVFGLTGGMERRLMAARVTSLLGRVGLGDVGRRGVGGFSTGMRQRLALALALLREPEMLIVDEPTNGLDPAGVVEVRHLLTAIAAEGRTIFLSTHVLTEVEQLCDRVAVLHRGKVIAQQATRDLLMAGQAVRVRFDDAATAGRAREVLTAAAFSVSDGPDGSIHVAAGAESGSRIARTLAEGAVYPAELAPVRTSLEAVFLELTGAAEADR